MEHENRQTQLNIPPVDLWMLLADLLHMARRTVWLGVLLVVLLGGVFGLGAYCGDEPEYRVSASFAVTVTDPLDSGVKNYNSAMARQMEKTFPSIINSSALRDLVAEELGTDALPEVDVSVLDSTGIFTLSVVSSDPQEACDTLNAFIRCCPQVAEPVVGPIDLSLLRESGIPYQPCNAPDVPRGIKRGAVVGAVLWLVILVLSAVNRSAIHNEDELKWMTDLTCLGTIPFVGSRKASDSHPVIAPGGDRYGFSEAVRLLRIRLEREMAASYHKVLLVSGAIPGEGKTTVAVNLALALAQKGKRTLLVDLDLRSSHPNRLFGKGASLGVSDCLEGRAGAEELPVNIIPNRLDVVFSGSPTASAAELLGGDALRSLVSRARERYDYVILDTPPCAMFSDAAEAAGLADCALMVVRQNFSSRDRIWEGMQLLSGGGLPLVGAVLNGIRPGVSARGRGYEPAADKEIRDVSVEDLLGRDKVRVDLDEIGDCIRGKTVLVTGGGGSIGSELCRQIALQGPEKLVIFDIYENNAYDIQQELAQTHPELALEVLIGSVRDCGRMEEVFRTHRPHLVCHAAAHKHVPLMEGNPNEAIKNNVFGTLHVARAADKFGAEKFILISSDKAVNPTNVMGATKRICEMIIQVMGQKSRTVYSAVRFGNVLGSNGSVIPLFRRQIQRGGPVTVTHKDVSRYFMTISEAVSLVLQACAYARGGEIFVLDMGDPVRIDDLARNMIRLSGLEPEVDIPIVYTGLRPGEKLFEELLMQDEGLERTPNELIFVGHFCDFDPEGLMEGLEELDNACRNGQTDIRPLIRRLVRTYQPQI